MQNNFLSRISGAPWFEAMSSAEITVVGLGGIGSHLVYSLGRLGIKSIDLFDFDKVEDVNMTGQFYSTEYIGRSKSEASAMNLVNYSGLRDINSFGEFVYSADDPYFQNICNNYTFCGLDSMSSRKTVFESWVDCNMEAIKTGKNIAFIDGRLAAEDLQILTVRTLEDIEKYRKEYLFSDEEKDETICSYKQTTYSAMIIAGLMTNIFINIIYNDQYGNGRRVPFFLEMECPILNLKLED